MKDGELATMMQHQEEDVAQKLMEKEYWARISTPTGKASLLIQRVLSLHHFLQSYIPQNLGVVSKVTTLENGECVFISGSFTPSTSRIQSLRENATVGVGYHYKNSSSLGMICTNGLMNPTERITNRMTEKNDGLPIYDLWYMVCILCHLQSLFSNILIFFKMPKKAKGKNIDIANKWKKLYIKTDSKLLIC